MRQTVRRWLQFAVCHTKGSAHASHGCRRKVNKDGTERKVAAASDRKVGIEFHYAKLKYGTKSFCARSQHVRYGPFGSTVETNIIPET